MDHILQQMQAFSQQCAEILSEIVGIDVSITDNQQMRIAGSGRMKGRVGNIAAYGHIALHALETRQTTVVLNPIANPICQSCETRSTCDNLSELWTPIMLDHTPIGVIGCVCYSVSQRRQFIDRQDIYVRFFEEFASLLGNRAHALIEADRSNNIRFMLEHVLERVQVGTLILDIDNHIHDMNRQGRQILQLPADTQDFSRLHLKPIGADDSKQYCILNDEHQINIIGDIYNLGLNPYDRLLLFSSSIYNSDAADQILGLTPSSDLARIIGHSSAITTLKKSICQVAKSSSSIFITGESGTGKELVARAVHGESLRSDKPFVAVNCAALPESLLESELFGYVKGAFTGANPQGKKGLLETAQGGTFFMDEIGEMPMALQTKLLRVLEQREMMRLGSNTVIPIDIRFIFATHKDLKAMTDEGTFRNDLYYRINVIPLQLPPLRERRSDIRPIAESFIRKFSSRLDKRVVTVKEDFWVELTNYDWPGNVRELQNAIEYAMNMMPASGILYSELLHGRFHKKHSSDTDCSEILNDDWTLDEMEAAMIRRSLEQFSGQKDGKRLAAQKLGIGLATLYRKMKKYNLT